MRVQGHKTYGVTGNRWGTITRVEPTGMLMPTTLDIPRDIKVGETYHPPTKDGTLIYVRWDGLAEEDTQPYLELQLEVESAVARLGDILDEDEE
jgi:hypothetical protein